MALIASKNFITDNFLLNSDIAIKLYHDFAKNKTISDTNMYL